MWGSSEVGFPAAKRASEKAKKEVCETRIILAMCCLVMEQIVTHATKISIEQGEVAIELGTKGLSKTQAEGGQREARAMKRGRVAPATHSLCLLLPATIKGPEHAIEGPDFLFSPPSFSCLTI
jgi:hypothetical protein